MDYTTTHDADTMLAELGVDDEKILKCNAHVLLCIDNANNITFKDIESLIGSKLTSESASHVFNSQKCSTWYLGLIAFSKLLSPSHCDIILWERKFSFR